VIGLAFIAWTAIVAGLSYAAGRVTQMRADGFYDARLNQASADVSRPILAHMKLYKSNTEETQT
jgi:hypothetical protein